VASISEEAGETVIFTITLSQAVGAGNSVAVDITEVAGGADTASDTTATLLAAIDGALPAGVTRSVNTLTFDDTFAGTTFSFSLTTQDDVAVEGTEALGLQLTNAVNANGTTGITTVVASSDITETDSNAPIAADDPAGDYNTTLTGLAPLSYWRLGETAGTNAVDAGSSANDGTYTNAVALNQAGVINGDADRSVHFDGIDDHILIPHSADYLVDDGAGGREFQVLEAATFVGGTGSTPSISEDGQRVYVSDNTGNLIALDNQLEELWRYDVGDRVYASPAIGANGNIYVTTTRRVYALDVNGTELWNYYFGFNSHFGSPAIGADGTIYVAHYTSLYAINPNGSLKWSTVHGSTNSYSSPAIAADGTIYFGSVQTMPFARPAFAEILGATKFVLERGYPARGEVVDHASAQAAE